MSLFNQDLLNNTLLVEAFERIGILGNNVTPLQWDSALRSLNFSLQEMANANSDLDFLWYRSVFALNNPQTIYSVDPSIQSIKGLNLSAPQNAIAISNNTLVNGEPLNEESIPYLLGISDTELEAGNEVGFVFTDSTQILFLKVDGFDPQPDIDITLKINFYSFDYKSNPEGSPIATETFVIDSLVLGSSVYFCIQNPVSCKSVMISCDGNLSLKQISFLTNSISLNDRPLSILPMTDYMSNAQKILVGQTPSYYIFKKNKIPNVIFNGMSNQFSICYFLGFFIPKSNKKLISYLDNFPNYATDYLINKVALQLASKFAPDRIPILENNVIMSLRALKDSQTSLAPVKFRVRWGDYYN